MESDNSSSKQPNDASSSSTSLYSWEYIWSAFMRAPRVRAWLFSNKPPPRHHVYHSLQAQPTLLGYEFFSVTKASQAPFPDIGDLATAYTTDGHTLLGFNYGFRAVQPFIPPLHVFTNDEYMSDATALVRRTARRLHHFSNSTCFLSIEFSWFQSGALAVSTCINPLPSKPTAGMLQRNETPYHDHMELRFFSPSSAARLTHLADLANAMPSGQPLPPDLMAPHEDHYVLRVRQPPFPCASVIPANKDTSFIDPASLPKPTSAHFNVLTEAVAPGSTTATVTTKQSDDNSPGTDITQHDQSSALTRNSSQSSEFSDYPPKLASLWGIYRGTISRARQRGMYMSLVGRTKYSPLHDVEIVGGRYGIYTFMSTPFTVHGRIQRLCSQLGLSLSSPAMDSCLLKFHTTDMNHSANSSVELDHTSPSSEESGHKKRSRVSAFGDQDVDRGHSNFQRPCEQALETLSVDTPERGTPRFPRDVLTDNPCQAGPFLNKGGMSGSSSAGLSWITSDTSEKRCRVRNPHALETICGEAVETKPVRPNYRPVPISDMIEKGDSSAGGHGVSQGEPSPVGFFYTAHTRGADNANSDVGATSDFGQDQITERKFCKSEDTAITDNVTRAQPSDGDEVKVWYKEVVDGDSGDSQGVCGEENVGLGKKEEDQLVGEGEAGSGEVGRNRKMTGEAEGGSECKWSNMIWTCDRCGAKIRGKRGNLNRHIASKHDNVRAFVCETYGCGRRFQTRLNLVRHVTAVHDGRPFACNDCPRAFKTNPDREAHVRTAHLQCGGRLSCSICGGCFGRRSTLNRHMANVHKVRYVSP